MKEGAIKIPGSQNNCALWSVLIDSYNNTDNYNLKILLGEDLAKRIEEMSYEEFDKFLLDNLKVEDNTLDDAFKKFREFYSILEGSFIEDSILTNLFSYQRSQDGISFEKEESKRIKFLGENQEAGHYEVIGEPDLFPKFQEYINIEEERIKLAIQDYEKAITQDFIAEQQQILNEIESSYKKRQNEIYKKESSILDFNEKEVILKLDSKLTEIINKEIDKGSLDQDEKEFKSLYEEIMFERDWINDNKGAITQEERKNYENSINLVLKELTSFLKENKTESELNLEKMNRKKNLTVN